MSHNELGIRIRISRYSMWKRCRAISSVYMFLSAAYMLEVKCNPETTTCILGTSAAEYKLSSNLKTKKSIHLQTKHLIRKKLSHGNVEQQAMPARHDLASARRSRASRVKEMSQLKSASPHACCNDPSRACGPLAPSLRLICPHNVTRLVQCVSWRVLTLAKSILHTRSCTHVSTENVMEMKLN